MYYNIYVKNINTWNEAVEYANKEKQTIENSEKAKLCLQKLMSIDNQEVKSVEIQTLAGSNGSRKNHVLVTNYKPSPNVNSFFDYFSNSDPSVIKLAQRATLEYGVDPDLLVTEVICKSEVFLT